MNKRWLTIISCLSILGITVVLLLVFLLCSPSSPAVIPEYSLSASVKNLNISVGDKIYDFYEINDKNAVITFEVNKEGIIEINKDYILGVNEGEVSVILHAKTSSQSTSYEFIVVVHEKNYTVKIDGIENCSFDDKTNTLFAYDNVCQILFNFYDLKGNVIKFKDCDFILSDTDAEVYKEFSNAIFTIYKNCCLSIRIDYSKVVTYINIVLIV